VLEVVGSNPAIPTNEKLFVIDEGLCFFKQVEPMQKTKAVTEC
jgi:hypothetical protein